MGYERRTAAFWEGYGLREIRSSFIASPAQTKANGHQSVPEFPLSPERLPSYPIREPCMVTAPPRKKGRRWSAGEPESD
jgi:hypothetical protein